MTQENDGSRFAKLVELTRHLRSGEGCAWDRAQTIETIRPHLVEEFHEALEAMDERDDGKLRDELGDLLFLIVFISVMGEEAGRFALGDVVTGIDEKLRRRHPHVFGDVVAETPDEVRATWETQKLTEKSHADRESMLDGLPREFSALLSARRMQEKAASVGFDWPSPEEVLDKIVEETGELREELRDNDRDRQEDEIGDLLFAVVNIARYQRIDPEAALRRTNLKFRTRFAAIERRFKGTDLREVGLEAMDRVWNEVKEEEKQKR